MSPIRRTGDTPVADGGHEGVLRSPTTHLARKQLLQVVGERANKQLIQVVGGPGKLFLPVGAKTCFGGWAARKHPLLSFGVKGWPCFFPSRPKSDFGAAADRGLDFQGDRIREGQVGWG